MYNMNIDLLLESVLKVKYIELVYDVLKVKLIKYI